jgi:hypothetical protein
MKRFAWVFTAVGLVFSIASATRLFQAGFHAGSFVAPIQHALDWYGSLLSFLLGWAEPYLQKLPAQWHPYSHWKDLFVIFVLYFITVIRCELSLVRWSVAKEEYVRPIRRFWLALLVAPLLAFVYSVAIGSTPIDIDYSDAELGLLGFDWYCRIFVLGMLVFAFVLLDVIAHPEVRFRALAWLVSGSSAIIAICLVLRTPVLLILLALFVLTTAYNAVLAAERAFPFGMTRPVFSRAFWVHFRREAGVSLAIVGTLGGAAAFVLTSQGLRLAGL